MIQVVNLLADHLFIELKDIPLLNTPNGNEDERSAKCN